MRRRRPRRDRGVRLDAAPPSTRATAASGLPARRSSSAAPACTPTGPQDRRAGTLSNTRLDCSSGVTARSRRAGSSCRLAAKSTPPTWTSGPSRSGRRSGRSSGSPPPTADPGPHRDSPHLEAARRKWLRTTYRWSSDGETSATELPGGELNVNGTGYEVPSQYECSDCHQGRLDGVLGFEAVGLSAPGTSGVTLQGLVEAGVLTAPPTGSLQVPGDRSSRPR